MDNGDLVSVNEVIREIIVELEKIQLRLPIEVNSIVELKDSISTIINDLIANDFSRLISLLYRLDISEKKLRQSLATSATISAGDIIAEMIIERQKEKIKTRRLFARKNDACDEEKW